MEAKARKEPHLRPTDELPKAGQLWRVKDDVFTGSDLADETEGLLAKGTVLMVTSDGEWELKVDTEGWLLDVNIMEAFTASVIYGEQIFERMRFTTMIWKKWFERAK